MSRVEGMKQAFRSLDARFWGGYKVRLESGMPKTVNVGTTATQVVPANPQRVALFIANKSVNPGHVDTERSVSTSRGMPVTQNGGNIEFRYDEDGSLVQAAFFGINETAAGDWYVWALELAEP